MIISNAQMKESGVVDFATFTMHVFPGAVLGLLSTYVLIRFAYYNKLTRRAPVDPLLKEIEVWRKTLLSMDNFGEEETVARAKLSNHLRSLETQYAQKRGTFNVNESNHSNDAQEGAVARNSVEGSRENDDSNFSVPSISEMESKYVIGNITLFIKTICVLFIVIVLFFIHSFTTELHLTLPWIAILGALVLCILSGLNEEAFHTVLSKVEVPTLLFFAGLFIIVRCVEELGVTLWIAEITSDLITQIPEVCGSLHFF